MDRVPIKFPRWLLLASFLCGAALLAFGLYRWPPNQPSFSRPRRDAPRQSSGLQRPDFNSDSADVLDVLIGTIDYFSAALFLVSGLVVWRRHSVNGTRLTDLWSEDWRGGRLLGLVLPCQVLLSAYAVLVCIGLVLSLI